jgi:hypothetical protein
MSPFENVRLDSFTPWVGLGITFSVYVWFHIARYKSHAPHLKYIHWERFVPTVHFVDSTESGCFTRVCKTNFDFVSVRLKTKWCSRSSKTWPKLGPLATETIITTYTNKLASAFASLCKSYKSSYYMHQIPMHIGMYICSVFFSQITWVWKPRYSVLQQQRCT